MWEEAYDEPLLYVEIKIVSEYSCKRIFLNYAPSLQVGGYKNYAAQVTKRNWAVGNGLADIADTGQTQRDHFQH